MARPQKILTDEQIKEVEILAPYLSIEQLADHFGIRQNTFQQIMKRQPRVFEVYKKGKSHTIAFVAKSLLSKIRDEKDTTAILFYLKTQAGWSEKKDNKPIINTKKLHAKINNIQDINKCIFVLFEELLSVKEMPIDYAIEIIKAFNSIKADVDKTENIQTAKLSFEEMERQIGLIENFLSVNGNKN